jgi:uncharacterized protein (DUF1778 family)
MAPVAAHGRKRLDPESALPPAKTERIELRVSPERKKKYQQAAALSGSTLTDFVINSSDTASEEIFRAHHRLDLSARDVEIIMQTLLNPPSPDEELLNEVKQYKKLVTRT